ncbi:hypothetical protein BOTBODRAFT_511690 [Botryobasidium botryosum FD-172 SS1]|uniref:Uncharacterized protein n=1 Tax=Botryobasidium botryosum (strain FD-172 SS1) TaxID=930990 RepID=A0A067N3T9_BOTB1|nr:hypothetical protein BOTBODRAFT_511690 [Botryobasidium botryosum FD-172 SS1]
MRGWLVVGEHHPHLHRLHTSSTHLIDLIMNPIRFCVVALFVALGAQACTVNSDCPSNGSIHLCCNTRTQQCQHCG